MMWAAGTSNVCAVACFRQAAVDKLPHANQQKTQKTVDCILNSSAMLDADNACELDLNACLAGCMLMGKVR